MIHSPLLTDSYQLAMMQSYVETGMTETAVFEFFARTLPKDRQFLIAAGLEQLIEYLETLRFSESELNWLSKTGGYHPRFLDYLRDFRFTGDVNAIAEGTPFFPNEPIVQIVAPLPEAQLIESRLINILHFQTIIASKAIRSTLIAPQKHLVDFGMRRAHGADAALYAARASYLAGFSGTSTVLAGERFGIPVYGTMAHSFIQAHPSEESAFRDFARTHSGPITFLIDTYDTEAGAEKVAKLAPELMTNGTPIQGVRLDSGDLAEHARKVRSILDRYGLNQLQIFASGNLDERAIQRLLESEAPIDGFGVGTKLITSSDAPYLECAYKLEEYAGKPKRKKSEGKATWPGRKQVWRIKDSQGRFLRDELRLQNERKKDENDAEPLLKSVMRQGNRLGPPIPVHQIREYCLTQISFLPPHLQKLDAAPSLYPVEISEEVRTLARSS